MEAQGAGEGVRSGSERVRPRRSGGCRSADSDQFVGAYDEDDIRRRGGAGHREACTHRGRLGRARRRRLLPAAIARVGASPAMTTDARTTVSHFDPLPVIDGRDRRAARPGNGGGRESLKVVLIAYAYPPYSAAGSARAAKVVKA